MRAIFVSYRRDDTEGQAGRLFADLTHHFGPDAVFMDVAAIEPGRDFRRAIDQHVSSCGVLLALMGKHWLTAQDESGARRLNDPMDFVRLEIASALKRDIPVIPVLVHGAGMPRVEELPEDLKDLAFRNAVELTHARWDSDVQLLVKALRPHVQVTQAPPVPFLPSAPVASGSGRIIPTWAMIVGLVSVLVLAGGWYLWHQRTSEESQRQNATPEPIASPSVNASPSPTYRGLVGTWLTGTEALCTLVIQKDDGKNIVGSCDNVEFRHKFTGVYTTSSNIKITITRTDKDGRCTTSVNGSIEIVDSNTIDVSQEGWHGECGAISDPVKLRARRSSPS
jgi:hypothetical protein